MNGWGEDEMVITVKKKAKKPIFSPILFIATLFKRNYQLDNVLYLLIFRRNYTFVFVFKTVELLSCQEHPEKAHNKYKCQALKG